MTDYRVYFFDSAGHIIAAHVITCASDADALLVASTSLDRHPALEVWQRARRVGRIAAAPVSGQPPNVIEFP